MSDTIDDFRAMKDVSKKKRAENRERGAQALLCSGIHFETRNEGAHLIVRKEVDYWPGTGKWIVRSSGQTGRGIKPLLKWLKKTRGA